MSDYKELHVWKNSIHLAKEIYLFCHSFPEDEKFGLSSQMKRSAVSIASNIAEGSGRSTQKDFAHFVSMAQGSACELETQVILAHELNFISNTDQVLAEIVNIRKMLHALRNSLLK